ADPAASVRTSRPRLPNRLPRKPAVQCGLLLAPGAAGIGACGPPAYIGATWHKPRSIMRQVKLWSDAEMLRHYGSRLEIAERLLRNGVRYIVREQRYSGLPAPCSTRDVSVHASLAEANAERDQLNQPEKDE